MSQTITVTVPDIGDFHDVDIIDIMVKPGDTVTVEQPLIVLESDKASMEVPSTHAGVVQNLMVKVGDKVSQGSEVAVLTAAVTATAPSESTPAAPAASPTPAMISTSGNADLQADVVVLGAGPGGYTAAFRAADLGKKVVLIEKNPTLGGVCLNVGCIPSKALLHVAQIINEAATMEKHGVSFNAPSIDLPKLAEWKQGVVNKLTQGLMSLAKKRKVTVIHGEGQFTAPKQIQITTADGVQTVSFEHAIIAAGSRPTTIPSFPHDDPRVMDSTGALALEEIPPRLLVIGGGIIGLEMATVYDALGSKITVVELLDSLIAGADKDIVKPLHNQIKSRYENIFLQTKVTQMQATPEGIVVNFEGPKAPEQDTFDRVLVSVGRRPNGLLIGAENAGVTVDERGFIAVDKQMRTNVPHIFAIGDIVGQPMLAHKAVHEGKVAAEVIAGHKRYFDARTIPSVAYTDPEVAWMGMTETEAKEQGIAYEKGVFPWAASGRALSIGRGEGTTKLLFDRDTKRLIGAGIVGVNAGELLAEAVLAYEMDADVEDLGLTIHAHPTLSETLNFAAEMAEGTITDLYAPRKTPW